MSLKKCRPHWGPHAQDLRQGSQSWAHGLCFLHTDWGLPSMCFSLEISITSVFPKGHTFTVGKF